MSDIDIIRPATETEKQDFIEIGKTNILDVFMKKLSAKQQEYAKEYKPFDRYGARVDFDEQVAKIASSLSTSIDQEKAAKKISIPNLDKYGDDKLFDFLGTEDVKEDKLLDGIRNTVSVGRNYNYKVKSRGNSITVYVPLLDVEKVEARIKPKK